MLYGGGQHCALSVGPRRVVTSCLSDLLVSVCFFSFTCPVASDTKLASCFGALGFLGGQDCIAGFVCGFSNEHLERAKSFSHSLATAAFSRTFFSFFLSLVHFGLRARWGMWKRSTFGGQDSSCLSPSCLDG
ncbi:uncharacterized protein J3D65DRAFT_112705 [Phyllosticta citribraziliensis]|uniref:Secreted protein n=1 Tax=Phyllosticta citribraziliensis TaxID=989973 RepID=A0ABR1L824_9PEZI